jgi:hypothetical protein
MTPEKIKRLRLAKMEKREAIRALRQVKRDDARRTEEERLQKKLLETAGARKQAQILWRKHSDSGHVDWKKRGTTVDKRHAKNLFTNLGKHFKDERTRDKRDEEREVKSMPRDEMTAAQEYEADILQIDSLMYIPVDWGESDSPNNKRRRGQVVSVRHRMKPRVREHFKGLIKLPETNTTNVVEDLSPAWVEDVFRPVFVELVKKSPRQWWPVVVGNAR